MSNESLQATEPAEGWLIVCVARTAELQGLDDLSTVEFNGLAAVVDPIDSLDAIRSPDRDRLIAFDRRMQRVFAQCESLVPFRFGTRAESLEDVRMLLEKLDASLRAGLANVEGCVEMGLRIPLAEQPEWAAESASNDDEATNPGRAYLKARMTAYQEDFRREQLIERLVERSRQVFDGTFRELSADVSGRVLFGRPTVSISFLVPRADLDGFNAVAASLDGLLADATLSGPWPPYSFVAL